MKPSYEELEEQLNRSRRLCDAALANERVWETTMMQACGEDGPKSVADKFAELEAKCAALAAENARLKAEHELAVQYMEELRANFTMYKKFKCQSQSDVATPATDAFLAEVRAQGVEMLNTQFKKCTGILYADSVVSTAEHFAAQLRKGVQS